MKKKMKRKLVLRSISSSEVEIESWYPPSNESVFVCLDLEIGFSDDLEGSNMFYVTLTTPEALIHNKKGPILIENRTLVVVDYSYKVVKNGIESILDRCTRETWEDSCLVLQRYFHWEYEDYSVS